MRKLNYNPYLLRDVAREHWEYATVDEIVYLPQSLDGHIKGDFVRPEDYIEGRVWIEAIILDGHDDLYCAIIESSGRDVVFVEGRGASDALGLTDNDPSMPVRVRKLMQYPESLGYGLIPSVVRLKKLDSLFSLSWQELGPRRKSVGAPFFEDWELSIYDPIPPMFLPEGVDKPVEGGAHIDNGVASDDANVNRDSGGGDLQPDDLKAFLRFQFGRNYAGVISMELRHESIKGFQVFFRPKQFMSWSVEDMHKFSLVSSAR